MKKNNKHIFLALIFLLLLAGCGPKYSVKHDVMGSYQTAELEMNMLSSNSGTPGDIVVFNLKKYSSGSRTVFTAIVLYAYPQARTAVFGAGEDVDAAGFGLKQANGVYLSVNGSKAFPLKYRSKPEHIVHESDLTVLAVKGGAPRSGSLVGTHLESEKLDTRKNHMETVECILEPKWIPFLVKAKSIEVTLLGTDIKDPAKIKKKVYFFTKENFNIINQFYQEEVLAVK